jgi:protein-S-isoprenylcysteine O-methyltransferase Ste14
MTTTTILAYVLIAGYFIVERSLRKGEAALSLVAGECDRNSLKVILLNGLVNILLVLSAPLLNSIKVGYWDISYGCWMGIALMVLGLFLRGWAAATLGEFYTRTLQIVDGQAIVDQAPYSIIRHPGYAGLSLMEIGASLAVSNWIVLIAVVILGASSRLYRIQAEEEMLETSLKEQYRTYQDRTWRLIPFIF